MLDKILDFIYKFTWIWIIVFIILKFFGPISWLIVFLPLLIQIGIVTIAGVVLIIFFYLLILFDSLGLLL